MTIGISILVTLLLVLVNGYFSLSEMAVVSSKRVLLQKDADEGDEKAARALRLTDDMDRFLATIQVAITLVGFFASAVAAVTLSDPFAAWMASLGVDWLAVAAPVLAPILITLAVSYVSIVLGELLPKRIALSDPERAAKRISGSILGIQKVLKPLVHLNAASANGLAKVFHVKTAEERQDLSEEEIRYMVADNDELDDAEKQMIHDVLDLGDTTAGEVMTPRVDMIMVEDSETVRQAIDRMRGTGYSRLPVFTDDRDNVIGIVRYKDLIDPLLEDREDDPVKEYAADVEFIPESKDLVPLLNEMQTNRQQMAIVVDEYGGTAGLITIEDIVEEIVGEIADESDLEDRLVTAVGENEWIVDGSCPCETAQALGWPVTCSESYETISGWLMDTFDCVPQLGDEFTLGEYTFKIQQMRRRRIALLRVKRMRPSAAGGAPMRGKPDHDGKVRQDS